MLSGFLGVGMMAVAALQTGSCPVSGEMTGYTVHRAELHDPFAFLRGRSVSTVTRTGIDRLVGKPFDALAIEKVWNAINAETEAPATSQTWVSAFYAETKYENCEAHHVDVVFTVLSAAISTTLAPAFEWNVRDPMSSSLVGSADRLRSISIAPRVSFDRARELSGGVDARATWGTAGALFNSASVTAVGSSESHFVSAALSGSHDSAQSWLRRFSWDLSYNDRSDPAGETHLTDRRWQGVVAAASRADDGVVARGAALVAGGRSEGGFTGAQLAPNTVDEADFTSATFAGGVTGRWAHHALAASYAFILGARGSGFSGDWRKQLAEVSDDFWSPIGDHRLVELEQRLSAGRLDTLGIVPVSERFFAGNGSAALTLTDGWELPTNPVIRSVPTNAFFQTANGAGGDRFLAYNATVGVTAWRLPLVPATVYADHDIRRNLDAQLVSARSLLEIFYRTKDSHFAATLAQVKEASTILDGLATNPSNTDACKDTLTSSRSAVKHALGDKSASAYGWVIELLPDGNNALADVTSACQVKTLDEVAARIASNMDAIDKPGAAARASADTGYAGRAISLIMDQLNMTSISPVGVFDVMHLGPATSSEAGGTRYGVGGGVRLTLASTVSFTATYAVNPHRQSGESSGAFVFALTMRNLFD